MSEFKARIEPKGQIHAVQVYFSASNIVEAVETIRNVCSPQGWVDEYITQIVEVQEVPKF